MIVRNTMCFMNFGFQLAAVVSILEIDIDFPYHW
jgi:hypothetical protein